MRIFIIISSILILNIVSGQTKRTLTATQKKEYLEQSNWEVLDFKSLLENNVDKSTASKEETQKWIAEKLSLYTVSTFTLKGRFMYNDPINNQPLYEIDTYSVLSKDIRFEKKYLIIQLQYKITTDNSTPKYQTKIDSVYLPNLKNVDEIDKELIFWFYSNPSDKLFYSLRFNSDRETEIVLRLKKAFLHLCKDYWKSVKGETF